MQGFEYANARLRAMKSRLLTSQQVNALTETGSVEGLLIALDQTPYQPAIEAAMGRALGQEVLSLALRQDLIATLGKIRRFFSGPERSQVALVLRTYDLHNVKALLRGLGKHLPVEDIMAALLPVGCYLTEPMLVTLASAPRPGAAIDMLASMGVPLAHPLIQLRQQGGEVTGAEMELALERWHLKDAFTQLGGRFSKSDGLSLALTLDADLTNLLTAIRLAHTPLDREVLRKRLGSDDLRSLWVGPGQLSFANLGQAAEKNTAQEAVEFLVRTAYGAALTTGLDAYHQTGQIGEFERTMRRYRLQRVAALVAREPLGIGVLLGYLALKINEIGNLRWIAHALSTGLDSEQIRRGLELVA